MQKAAAILQFKLEGQTSRRNPHFELESRCLLHQIDPAAGTVTIDGKKHELLDRAFPTIDFADPYRLSEAEQRCIDHLKRSFMGSPSLWRDMSFVADHGSMFLMRDENVIFHGCVPVDEKGAPLPFEVDGAPQRGRALFEALDRSVRRAFRERSEKDVDLLYYLWAGPRSPLFGKDRMATFETYFVADKATALAILDWLLLAPGVTMDYEVAEQLVIGERVCRRHVLTVGVPGHEPVVMPVAIFFTVRDGLIRRIDEYVDTRGTDRLIEIVPPPARAPAT